MARTELSDGEDQNNGNTDCDPLPEHSLNDPPASCQLTLPIVSDHAVSSGRSRSRNRRRRRRRHSPPYSKRSELNTVAALFSMVAIMLLCIALAKSEWIYLRGGGCKDLRGNIVDYLGVNQFFYFGHFLKNSENAEVPKTIYKYGTRETEVLVDCVTVEVVSIMRGIISLCFLGILLSTCSLLLDLLKPTYKVLTMIRRIGLLNIMTAIFCVVINGFCYWATEDLAIFQQLTKLKAGSKIDVNFGLSFFLITAAGSVSVIAAACNLLRRHPVSPAPRRRHHDQDLESLLSDIESVDFVNDAQSSPTIQLSRPPPPPYAP